MVALLAECEWYLDALCCQDWIIN